MVKSFFSTNKRINEKKVRNVHLASDFVFVFLSHLFLLFTFPELPSKVLHKHIPDLNENFAVPLFFITSVVYWLYTFYLFGHYTNTDKKSGLSIIWPSVISVISASAILFFFLLKTFPYLITYGQFAIYVKYISLLCILVIGARIIIILIFQYHKRVGNISYNTILIGNNKLALSVIEDFLGYKYNLGFKFIGYLSTNNRENKKINQYCKHLGPIHNLSDIIEGKEIDEAVVCLEHAKHAEVYSVITTLKQLGITIRLNPDITSILEGSVKTTTLETLPFITITPNKMPVWQSVLKRFFDLTLAWTGLIVCAPLFLILSVLIKLNSKGPIFYKQNRVGKNKKLFKIYKFRSMHVDAERKGPQLASENDSRITSLGRYMRKWRLDEMPQFFNVILGDMSFVGPRPERSFYINKILPLAPHYAHLFTVKPGITSWGMVKYGYAQSVDEMIERLQFDLLYLENQTLLVDFKIILFTTKTIIGGEGK